MKGPGILAHFWHIGHHFGTCKVCQNEVKAGQRHSKAKEETTVKRLYIKVFQWFFTGAGSGNRTRVASLEGWNSTIELHPRLSLIYKGLRVFEGAVFRLKPGKWSEFGVNRFKNGLNQGFAKSFSAACSAVGNTRYYSTIRASCQGQLVRRNWGLSLCPEQPIA